MTAAGIEAPFPGLRPFKTSEAHLFFGRDEQVEALLARVAERRLLAVVGTSGSGKSSLVHAGLIPALERAEFGPPGSRWIISVVLRPGIGPLNGLARALGVAFGRPESETQEIRVVLGQSSLGLSDFAWRRLRPGEHLMVVVDQFEELMRYRWQTGDQGRVESTAFVKLLLAATGNSEVNAGSRADAPVYVVLTMRSDYLGRCAQFRGLPEALNDAQYLVPRISRDQEREAIEGPIAIAGAEISERLVERILNDAGDDPDQLPVLQHALLRVWEESATARAGNAAIDLSHYETVGGIAEALNRDANEAYGKLKSAAQEAIARRMFQRLVEPGAEAEETRRPTRLSEIALICGTTGSDVLAVIEVFRERGFMTLSDDQDPLIDISHESLIRQWKRLKEWVEQEARSAAIYSRLAESAVNRRVLYRGPDLAEALRWVREESPNQEWAFRYNKNPTAWGDAVKFLRGSERRQKLVRAGYALLVAAAIAVAGVFIWLYRNAQINALEKQKALTAFEEKNKALNLMRVRLLHQNGWSDERIRNASAEVIARSLDAGEALQALTMPSATVVPPTHGLRVIYYPKVADGNVVNQTIQQYWRLLGYAPSVVPAINDLPTNVIWFRGKVPADDLKRITLSLMRAGVQPRAIVRLIGSDPESVIIGSQPDFAEYRPWSVDEIVHSNQFGGPTSSRQSAIVVIERESDVRGVQFLTSRGIYHTTIDTGNTTFNGRTATRQMTQMEAEQLRQELEAAGIHCEIQKP